MPAVIELSLGMDHDPEAFPARLHGAACALLEPAGVPHRGQRKPFSVWPLAADGPHAHWRLGWLAHPLPSFGANHITFGPTRHPVLRRSIDEFTFTDLARTPPRRRATLDFHSPLYFSRNGRDHPLPDPTLIVRSAMDRWDHHAPDAFTIPTDARDDLLATVFLADMDGRTVRGAVGARTDQTGYLGTVVLALTRRATDPTAALFGAMLRFADIAGVGAQTTHGFGAVTLLSGPGTDQHRTTLNRRGPRNASSQFTPLPDLKVTPSTPDRRR